jgi:phage repressor protein C with HTH and peptisase S24 domain
MRSPSRVVASHHDGLFHCRQEQSGKQNGTFQNDKAQSLLDIPIMDFNRDSLLALIDEGLSQRGWSDSQLAKEAGLKPHNIADLRRGKTQILRGDRLQRVLVALNGPSATYSLIASKSDSPPEQVVMIPVYDVRASMGAGSVSEGAVILYHIGFRKDWLQRITSSPSSQLAAISAVGDSMEPTLSDGDTMLIDMSQGPATREDGIYVIDYDGLLRVKRLRFDPVRRIVRLISDNPAYDPVDDIIPDELRVFGRAIWLARRL